MRIAVTGKNGQVATALKVLARPGLEIKTLGRPELDLKEPQSILGAIRATSPDAVISAAAFTAVDIAESNIDAAFAVNRDGARAVAKAAAELGVPIIHLSTDYVFDGTKTTPYVEDDSTAPVSVYGRSKLEGELAVAAEAPNHVILRTSWVYSPYGNNFLKTMLKLADRQDVISVVSDQFGCPTSALDIAQGIINIAKRLRTNNSPKLRGVFHIAGGGHTSWAGLAKLTFSVLEDQTGRHVSVREIPTSAYPTIARRPVNSRLDCSKLANSFGIRLPNWAESAHQTVMSLVAGEKV